MLLKLVVFHLNQPPSPQIKKTTKPPYLKPGKQCEIINHYPLTPLTLLDKMHFSLIKYFMKAIFNFMEIVHLINVRD